MVCRGGWGYCVQVTEVCRLWFGARVVGCSGSSSGSGLHPQFCMGASSQNVSTAMWCGSEHGWLVNIGGGSRRGLPSAG